MWNKFFTGLKKMFVAIFWFFVRLLKDACIEIWKPTRKQIVKKLPVAILIAGFALLVHVNPEGATAILQLVLLIGLMAFGFRTLISGVTKKKKK